MMTRLINLVLFALFLTLPIGASASDKVVLRVSAFPAIDKIIADALPTFYERFPNVEVKITSRSYGDHHTALTTALAASSNLPDLVAVEQGYLGRFARGKGLTNLSEQPFSANEFKDLFVSYTFQQAQGLKGQLMGIPTDIGPGSLFYRHDIFDASGVSIDQAISSWSAFVDAGITIKKTTGSYLLAHARDLKDIVIRSNIPPGEGIYFDDQGNSLVQSPRFVRAFELALKAREAGIDAKIGAWSNEWAEGFRRGELATQMMGAWLGGHLQNWLAPNTSGKWRVSHLPNGAYASWGGTFYAIPDKATHKELAFELIKHLTLQKEQQSRAFQEQDAFPALLAAHDADFFTKKLPFFGNQAPRILWRDIAAQIPYIPVDQYDPIAEEIVNVALDDVLNGGVSVSQALAQAHRLIKRRARRR